jgi:glucose/arabinose dehydrogenase/type 1 glutamine amidotransferase
MGRRDLFLPSRPSAWRSVLSIVSSLVLMLGLATLPASQAQAKSGGMAGMGDMASSVRVLVFHGPAAKQDDPVTKATGAVEKLGEKNGFSVDESEDPSVFTAENLANYRGVVFLSANGVTLNADQEAAFQAYIKDGGGFVGVHDAARVQADSSWFTQLIGTRPAASATGGSPEDKVQQATVDFTDRQHPANKGLPLTTTRSDQWMNWAPNPNGKVQTIAQVQENTYNPGPSKNGAFHPVSWCRDYDGGRSFYTGMGRTDASYTDDTQFQSHLLGAIEWTTGMVRGDCKATIASNYTVERLTQKNQPGQMDQIGEPHGLTVAPDGKVFYIGKAACTTGPVPDWSDPNVGLGCGTIHLWDPKTQKPKLLTTLAVMGNRGSGDELVKDENGLVGITLDPNFEQNGWIYAYWMPHESIDRDKQIGQRTVSRFTFDAANQTIDQSTRKDLLHWPAQIHSCCHVGGGMAFDKQGNLYIGSGDDNSSGGAGPGYSGNNWTQDYKGVSFQDARRTAGNTNDLNGKIIRIHPEPDGTYTIPKGNLFTGQEEGGGKTRPEIYVMGVRNIARIAWDKENNWLTAGWVGPDANTPDPTWGEAKYETATIIQDAGNQGWPYCMGDKQPYRDRSNVDATQPAGWYDCDHLKNTSPRNTGLVDIPPARKNMIWYSPQGGGIEYPKRTDGSGLPTYKLGDEIITEPWFQGGSQAIMDGPTYHRNEVNTNSGVAWPAYWDNKWFIGDESESRNRVAVTVDPKTVAQHGNPAFGEDLSQIIQPGGGDTHLQSWMDAKFGPDGALYMLDYGGGFFTLDPNQKLIRITYHGGPATPNPSDAKVQAVQESTPKTIGFSSRKAGGVKWTWDFGDGSKTSNEANPTHTYADFGTYHATLKVTYANGEVATGKIDVKVGCSAPDARPTVWILDTNTGVANHQVGGGCTINDLIDDERSWSNHGDFVSSVNNLVNGFRKAGYINDSEAKTLKNAADQSQVGKTNGYESIFDGTPNSLVGWSQAPSGQFNLQSDGSIRSSGGLGMLWYTKKAYANFDLRLQFRDAAPGDNRANSGVFIRFPDLRTPVDQRPTGSCGTTGAARSSPAWVAIYCGQEIQIYDGDSGEPQKTGSVYNFAPTTLDKAGVTSKGSWNEYEIRVVGQHYTIMRNGAVINQFDNTPGKKSSRDGDPPTDLRQFISGFVGLQNHSDNDLIDFRNIRVRQL